MSEHTPSETDRPLSPKALAQAKLRARAARIARMRKRVIAVSLAMFALAFGAIAYDGSMGSTTAASTGTQTTASASTSSSSSGSDDTTSSSDDSSGASDDSSSSSPSDDSSSNSTSTVTTSQS